MPSYGQALLSGDLFVPVGDLFVLSGDLWKLSGGLCGRETLPRRGAGGPTARGGLFFRAEARQTE